MKAKSTGTTTSNNNSKFLLTFNSELRRIMDKVAVMSDAKLVVKKIDDDLRTIQIRRQEIAKDLDRLNSEDSQLAESERALSATKTFYLNTPNLQPASFGVPIGHLTVAAACEVVFNERQNDWITLTDLELELNRRGKATRANSIEIALKGKSDRFEWEKRGKKNFYRLRPASAKVVNLGTKS